MRSNGFFNPKLGIRNQKRESFAVRGGGRTVRSARAGDVPNDRYSPAAPVVSFSLAGSMCRDSFRLIAS
jgi:hypothetical protein